MGNNLLLFRQYNNKLLPIFVLNKTIYKVAHECNTHALCRSRIGQFWKWLASIIVVKCDHVEHLPNTPPTCSRYDSSDCMVSDQVCVNIMYMRHIHFHSTNDHI